MYANDTVLKSTNNKDYIALAHQSALLEVNDWLEKNKLTLNVKKNKDHEPLPDQKNENRPVEYFLNHNKIEDVDRFKYLGTHLDCKLKFHQHIDKIKKNFAMLRSVFSIEKFSSLTAVNICV